MYFLFFNYKVINVKKKKNVELGKCYEFLFQLDLK